jgi:O-6-methylguanine DNA methyltransferase
LQELLILWLKNHENNGSSTGKCIRRRFMPGIDLLKFKNFGKSSFSSIIGTIYYIWPIKTDRNKPGLSSQAYLDSYVSLDSESGFTSNADIKTNNPGKTIFFLSNSEKSFGFFIDYLKNRFPDCSVIDKASAAIEKELNGYLNGKTREMSLKPVYLCGTDFEKKIWETARKIAYGDVVSYKELAESAGYPNAFRAAGTALGNNPLMLVVPCHRVIRSNGEIGYFGGGEEIKLMLLDLEQPQQAEKTVTFTVK